MAARAPLDPHHRDRQQLHNAEVLARVGAAIIVEERVLTVDGLARLLGGLLADRSRLEAMGRAARRLRAADPAGAILRDMGLGSAEIAARPLLAGSTPAATDETAP